MVIYIIFCLIIELLSPCFSYAQADFLSSDITISQSLAQAEYSRLAHLVKLGFTAQAIDEAKSYLNQYPHTTAVRSLLIEAYSQENLKTQAKNQLIYLKLWQQWENNPQVAINYGLQLLKDVPNDYEINFAVGQFYFLQKNYPMATIYFTTSLSLAPHFIAAQAALIKLYLAENHKPKAQAQLNQALQQNPYSAVLIHYKRALANNPSVAPEPPKEPDYLAKFNQLWQLWKSGKEQQAIEEATQFLAQFPNDPIELSLGQFYFLQKKYSKALAIVDPMVTRNPSYVSARASLIEIYLSSRAYDKAKQILEQGLSLNPNDPQLLEEKHALITAKKIKQNQIIAINSAKKNKPIKFFSPKLSSAKANPYVNYVEGGLERAILTIPYSPWFNQYAKAFIQTEARNAWLAEIHHDHEFDQKANYGALQQTHIFNQDWYTNLNLGISDNSIYVPKYLIGATLFKKFLANKELVTYLGAQSYWFRPVYNLQVLNPGLVYYFKQPWIIELGLYLNRTNPGQVITLVNYFALTQGQDQKHFITFRVAFGREGYLPLGFNQAAVNYPSYSLSLTLRQWLGNHWGFNILGEQYHNSIYSRQEISLGIFKEFT